MERNDKRGTGLQSLSIIIIIIIIMGPDPSAREFSAGHFPLVELSNFSGSRVATRPHKEPLTRPQNPEKTPRHPVESPDMAARMTAQCLG